MASTGLLFVGTDINVRTLDPRIARKVQCAYHGCPKVDACVDGRRGGLHMESGMMGGVTLGLPKEKNRGSANLEPASLPCVAAWYDGNVK
jgi:hypothetical protein